VTAVGVVFVRHRGARTGEGRASYHPLDRRSAPTPIEAVRMTQAHLATTPDPHQSDGYLFRQAGPGQSTPVLTTLVVTGVVASMPFQDLNALQLRVTLDGIAPEV